MLHPAEHCSLLDISEGLLAGRQCPLEHKLGPKKAVTLGGEVFKLKVTFICYHNKSNPKIGSHLHH